MLVIFLFNSELEWEGPGLISLHTDELLSQKRRKYRERVDKIKKS